MPFLHTHFDTSSSHVGCVRLAGYTFEVSGLPDRENRLSFKHTIMLAFDIDMCVVIWLSIVLPSLYDSVVGANGAG